MRNIILISAFLLAATSCPQLSYCHCEIPCGIYDDPMRFDMLVEDIKTVEKSMKKIAELSKQKEKDYHQLVRWIVNKEEHADKIQHVVSQYFMTQRIRPVEPKDTKNYEAYVKKVTVLHEMLFYAMMAKQSTETSLMWKS
jgi:nickel superoxide dismutase